MTGTLRVNYFPYGFVCSQVDSFTFGNGAATRIFGDRMEIETHCSGVYQDNSCLQSADEGLTELFDVSHS